MRPSEVEWLVLMRNYKYSSFGWLKIELAQICSTVKNCVPGPEVHAQQDTVL